MKEFFLVHADLVMRARVLLLQTEHLSAERRVHALRTLVAESPQNHSLQFAEALVICAKEYAFRRNDVAKGLYTEAAQVCRQADPARYPNRAATLHLVLHSYGRVLAALGDDEEQAVVRKQLIDLGLCPVGCTDEPRI